MEENGIEFNRHSISLHIESVTLQDSGAYKCIVKTHDDKIGEAQANITVHCMSLLVLSIVELLLASKYIVRSFFGVIM